MIKKLIVFTSILTSTILAKEFSGIYGTAGISFGQARGDKTNYLEHTISGNDTINTNTLPPSSVLHPIFTIGYEKAISRILSFRLGLGYEMVGNEFIIEDGIKTLQNGATSPLDTLYTWEHKRVLSFNYLTVPLELKLKLPLNRSGLFAIGNAKLGFLLTAKDSLEHSVTQINPSIIDLPYNLPSASESYEKDIKNQASAVNMSLGFRIGGEFPIRRLHILLESGYDFGLIEIMKKEKLVERSGILTLLSIGVRLNTTSDE